MHTDSMLVPRLREAIECLKRALIGAVPHETTINLKLAKLHDDLEEWAEAAAYHRRSGQKYAEQIVESIVLRISKGACC